MPNASLPPSPFPARISESAPLAPRPRVSGSAVGSGNVEIRPAAPRVKAAPAVKVLVALNRIQLRQFFPDGFDGVVENAAVQVCVTDGISVSEWNEVLSRETPTALVSGWSTPALEPRHTAPNGGPIRYVCHLTGSVRPVVSRSCVASGLLVSNWGADAAPRVAEHALLLALAALRNLPAWADFLARPSFTHDEKDCLETRTLFHHPVALHGFGAVARALLPLLAPFGCPVKVFSEGVPAEIFQPFDVTPQRSLIELYRGARLLICCEALTARTAQSVGREELGSLAPGAVFVNVGRGAVVNEVALAEVARARGLRVALDVTAEEPPAPGSPLWEISGLLLSPHIAGPTLDQYASHGRTALKNLNAFVRGHPPANLVDLEKYDRAT